MRCAGIMVVVLFFFFPAPANAGAGFSTWSEDDQYRFFTLLSLQLADYTQSTQFNDLVRPDQYYVEMRHYQDEETIARGIIEGLRQSGYNDIAANMESAWQQRLQEIESMWVPRGCESNPLVRSSDRCSFSQNRALLFWTAEMSGVYWVLSRESVAPWRKWIISGLCLIHGWFVSRNMEKGFEPTTPVLPVIITVRF